MFGASLPSRAPAQWSVVTRGAQQGEEGEGEGEASSLESHCLILSGNFSVIFVSESPELMQEDMKRLHWRVDLPQEAEAHGTCQDQQTEVSLRWRGGEGEDRNLLNIVLSKKGRLVSLTGVFVRLHQEGRRHELTSNMAVGEKEVLSWPYRYSLSCPRTLYYPLYTLSHLQDKPQAFILMDNLMMEVITVLSGLFGGFSKLQPAGIQRGDLGILRVNRVIVQTVREEKLGVRVPLHPGLGTSRGGRQSGLPGVGHDLLLLLQVLPRLQRLPQKEKRLPEDLVRRA